MTTYYCNLLFDGSQWLQDVTISCAADGSIEAVTDDDRKSWPKGVTPLPVVLPGFVNSHSHGFQALFAGLAEHRLNPEDDFWSWRRQMYLSAATLTPSEIEAVYGYLFSQMLAAGYTHVCEFHYLHHDLDGSPYQPLDTTARAIKKAAKAVGIGLTLLPVWYRYSQFGRQPAVGGQKRFVMDDQLWRDYLQALGEAPDDGMYALGVAAHSLRAVAIEDIGLLTEPLAERRIAAREIASGQIPVHIHVSEQAKEVADCLAAYGKRPVELLLDQSAPHLVWNLVHATHVTEAEQKRMIEAKAVAVLCPTTEANLGDGAFPYRSYLGREGQLAIGSDSQVNLLPFAELQLMEYTARLAQQQRSVLASESCSSPARRLLQKVCQSAKMSAGLPLGHVMAGYRCDLIAYDTNAIDLPMADLPRLNQPAKEQLAAKGDQLLDYLMIHKPYAKPVQVVVGGHTVAFSEASSKASKGILAKGVMPIEDMRKSFIAIRQRLLREV